MIRLTKIGGRGGRVYHGIALYKFECASNKNVDLLLLRLETRVTREFKFELFTTRTYGSSRNSNFEADVLEIQLEDTAML